MKFLLSLSFVLLSLSSYSQKLIHEKDEFKKKEYSRTEWDVLLKKSIVLTNSIKYSLVKYSDSIYINAKIILDGGNKVFAVRDNEELLLLLDNDETVTLKNSKYTVSSEGGASSGLIGGSKYGLTLLYYFANQKDIRNLVKSPIKKVRIYTNEGYLEGDISKKNSRHFAQNLKLILSSH
ncbi:hypothetical protein ACG2LH_15770 [Zhouia sp. PK063]|uniref:hypothetical protein n=1 Tax=Zhouia sp. PK063 TaxID=3373602 RepID=UPI0037BCB966